MSTVRAFMFAALAWTIAGPVHGEPARPITLHPQNPHYLVFRGKPTVLITSGEHYGAVLNRDFDYCRYLDELKARGLNLTRTFSGTYREIASSFGIEQNTLAPTAACYMCPWPRSSEPGAGDGCNKFDLTQWDPAYFARLKDFVAQAGQRGIVVELSLFCTIYDDALWKVNPMNAANASGRVEESQRLDVYTLKHPGLTKVQDALVRKIVGELKGFDNVYFEICNEPYFGGVSRAWTEHMAQTIASAEADLPVKHLVAENIANGKAKVASPIRHVSILNFHYASPPETVAMNYALNLPLADDETGFQGTGDGWYRREGWEFLLAGGAIYSNLDYSFTCSHPNGTFRQTKSPGGGGADLRRQLAILRRFVEGFDFVAMKPNPGAVRVSRGAVRALVDDGDAYAVYYHGPSPAELTIELPAGAYRAQWLDTKSGKTEREVTLSHRGGPIKLVSPAFVDDVALGLRKTGDK